MAHRRWALALLSISSIVYLPSVNAQVPGQPYRLSDKDVNIIIRRIELRSDQFRSSLDSALDKSRYKSTRMEYVNSFIKDFYEQTKRLRDQFDKRSSATSDVQAVLESAVPIDEFMTRNRVSSEAQNHWTGLRNKLEALAIAYNIKWHWDSYKSLLDKGTTGCQPVVGPTPTVHGPGRFCFFRHKPAPLLL